MLRFWMVNLLLQAEQPAADPAQGPPPDGFAMFKSMLVPLIGIFAIFWLLVWWPESKKRKERQNVIASIKKGDTVVTTGGIIGKVWRADGPEVVIVVDRDKDVKMRFTRGAIFEVLKGDAPASGPAGASSPESAADLAKPEEERSRT